MNYESLMNNGSDDMKNLVDGFGRAHTVGWGKNFISAQIAVANGLTLNIQVQKTRKNARKIRIKGFLSNRINGLPLERQTHSLRPNMPDNVLALVDNNEESIREGMEQGLRIWKANRGRLIDLHGDYAQEAERAADYYFMSI